MAGVRKEIATANRLLPGMSQSFPDDVANSQHAGNLFRSRTSSLVPRLHYAQDLFRDAESGASQLSVHGPNARQAGKVARDLSRVMAQTGAALTAYDGARSAVAKQDDANRYAAHPNGNLFHSFLRGVGAENPQQDATDAGNDSWVKLDNLGYALSEVGNGTFAAYLDAGGDYVRTPSASAG
jgi:hypothetical protein